MCLCEYGHGNTTVTVAKVTHRGLFRHGWLLVSLIVVLLFVSCGKSVIINEYSIIPQPVVISMDKGGFTLSSSTKCYAGNVGQNDPAIKYISRMLRQWHLNPVLVGKPQTNCLQFIINETFDQELGDEGYSIDIDKDMVKVSANSERGLFYGFQTFVQMLPEDISSV